MHCPSCNDEFEAHVTWCASCRVELIPEGATPPPAVPDARLGLFHAAVAGSSVRCSIVAAFPTRP
jgi:hypothetical protein